MKMEAMQPPRAGAPAVTQPHPDVESLAGAAPDDAPPSPDVRDRQVRQDRQLPAAHRDGPAVCAEGAPVDRSDAPLSFRDSGVPAGEEAHPSVSFDSSTPSERHRRAPRTRSPALRDGGRSRNPWARFASNVPVMNRVGAQRRGCARWAPRRSRTSRGASGRWRRSTRRAHDREARRGRPPRPRQSSRRSRRSPRSRSGTRRPGNSVVVDGVGRRVHRLIPVERASALRGRRPDPEVVSQKELVGGRAVEHLHCVRRADERVVQHHDADRRVVKLDLLHRRVHDEVADHVRRAAEDRLNADRHVSVREAIPQYEGTLPDD